MPRARPVRSAGASPTSRAVLAMMVPRLHQGVMTVRVQVLRGRRGLLIAAAAVLVTVSVGAGVAIAGSAEGHSVTEETGALHDTGALIVQRIDLADPVAGSKWLSGAPIDDAQREAVVVDEAVQRATEQGVDTELVRRVFRAQIEASKVVQRGLMEQWKQHPDEAPTSAPELGAVRTRLDEIGGSLVNILGQAASIAASPECPSLVAAERERDTANLDDLHRTGVETAWQTFCSE
ncbi:gamma subclass chorismate mutase AroQ [Rathayibacter rathayi]|nr:gamma subclass chorismate mutase AroQ [Rathayibacter rathayi]